MVIKIASRFSQDVNESIHALHSGDCLRAIVKIADSGLKLAKLPTLKVKLTRPQRYMKL